MNTTLPHLPCYRIYKIKVIVSPKLLNVIFFFCRKIISYLKWEIYTLTHYKLCYFVRSTDRQKTGTVALNNANVNTDVCKSSFDCCSNFRRLIPMTSQWATSQTESNDRLASASFEVNRYYDISNEERTSSKLERNSTSVYWPLWKL